MKCRIAAALAVLALAAASPAAPARAEQTFEERLDAISQAVAAARAATVPPAQNTLTLYLYPSYYGLSWSSPAALTRSTVLNTIPDIFTKNGISIGHLSVEVNCQAEGGEPARRMASAMTKEKIGLGLLFHDFKGALEAPERIDKRLGKRARHGHVAFLTYKINPGTCHRLLRYYDEYRAKGYDQHYGLPNRPRYGEGAGCSAYGASYLELGGLLTEEQRGAWMKTLDVPLKYVGGPETGRKERLVKLLFPLRRTRWAQGEETSKTVAFYDPDSMYGWIMGKVRAHDAASDYQLKTLGRSYGIVFDATGVPTPDGPLWLTP